MAKSQSRGNREPKKPKALKPKAPIAPATAAEFLNKGRSAPPSKARRER